tara:strand:+ start:204 stop:527 length:324 start_codon:yes stop_codon:yes gene_type:complete
MSASNHLTWEIDPEIRSDVLVFSKRKYRKGKSWMQFVNRRYTAEHGGCSYETVFVHYDGDKVAKFLKKQKSDGKYIIQREPTKVLNLRSGSMVPDQDGKYHETQDSE